MSILRPFRIYKDIDLSFEINPVKKDISKKLDVNAVRQSIKNIVFTQFQEKPFRPNYGSPLYRLLFEPMDPITVEGMKQAIEFSIQNYEPRVILERIDLVPNYDENEYELTIFFTVVGISQPATFTTILKRLR